MKTIVLILSLLSASSFAQTVYKLNEVSKVAEPSGGAVAMNQFVINNLQIPIASAAKGLNGRVFVQGIVELDGSMSDVKVIRSLEAGADQEVLRILKLYRAWQPAIKDDKAVRLEMVYPVLIRTEPIPFYNPDQQAIIEYFDKKNMPTTDSLQYQYRNYIPVDNYGHARDHVLYQIRKGKAWKTEKLIPFTKEEKWAKLVSKNGIDSVKSYTTKAVDDNFESAFELITRQENGQLLAFEVYQNKIGPPAMGKYYFKSGLLKSIHEVGEEVAITNWYENGQLRSKTLSGNGVFQVLENWDLDGTALVVDGNGIAKIEGISDGGQPVMDEGKVVDGLKVGRWTSKWQDGTLVKEENFEKGKFVTGKRLSDGNMVTYVANSKDAGYKGGPNELYKFLGTNLSLGGLNVPSEGRVVVTFVITPDGTLEDYQIQNSVNAGVDKEVLRVVKLTNGNWTPAMINDEKVRVRYTLPINVKSETTYRVERTN